MNLWQVWLTPSETRNSLSVVWVSTISVVANGKRDMMGSHLVADLSRGLNDRLDNRGVSHSTNGGKGMDSRGDHWGSGVWEAVSVGASKNHSRVSLSVPLDDGMSGVGKAVSKTMVAKTGISHSSNSGSSNHRSVMDHREHRWVVDQGGGCAKDSGASSNDGRVGIPLDNSMSQRGSGIGKTISKTMVTQTSISHSGNSRSSNHSVVDHRRVVDQRGRCCEDLGVSSNDCGISLPLAIVAMETIAVVSNSNRDSVGSHLMADLSRGHLNGLDNRAAVNGTNRGKGVSCRGSNHWGSGVWEGSMPNQQLGVGLRGGGCRSNDCLSEMVLGFVIL